MQYRLDRNGEKISLLGYGCMRFSKKGSSIDLEKTEKEIINYTCLKDTPSDRELAKKLVEGNES